MTIVAKAKKRELIPDGWGLKFSSPSGRFRGESVMFQIGHRHRPRTYTQEKVEDERRVGERGRPAVLHLAGGRIIMMSGRDTLGANCRDTPRVGPVGHSEFGEQRVVAGSIGRAVDALLADVRSRRMRKVVPQEL